MALIRKDQIQQSDRRLSFAYEEHFIGALSSTQGGEFGFQLTGTGGTFGILAGEASRPGIGRLQTLAVATNNYIIRTAASFLLTTGTWKLAFSFRIPVLAAAAQAFTCWLGFGDSTAASAQPVDGIYVLHDQTTTTLRYVCVANSVVTTVSSSATLVAGNWYDVVIFVDAAGAANFSVNNGAVTQITTNVPNTASRDTGLNFAIASTVGTTSKSLDLDYVGLEINF